MIDLIISKREVKVNSAHETSGPHRRSLSRSPGWDASPLQVSLAVRE